MKKLLKMGIVLVLVLIFAGVVGADMDTGLVAHYPFNGNADDESGNENHGAVYGATLSNDRFGNPNSAYLFDGDDDYIEIQDDDSLDLTTTFTISLWLIMHSQNDNGYRLFDKTTAGYNDGYDFDTSGALGGRRMRLTGGSKNISANTDITINEWHHLAVVFNSGVSTFYLDGDPDGSGDHLSSSVSENSLTVRMGKAHGPDIHDLNGLMDDIRVYNRALSLSEIQQLYSDCYTQSDLDAQYQAGYAAGLAACEGSCPSVDCEATYNFFTGEVHIPCFTFNSTSYWLDVTICGISSYGEN